MSKKKKSNVDALNCRIGSQAAKINATLSKKPKSIEAISKATKLSPQRCKQHLRWMVNVRKLVKMNKAGEYYLP